MSVIVTTFSTLHGFNEDPSTVRKYPVPASVTVLAIHHGAQGMGYFKQLSPDLVMLLQLNGAKKVLKFDTLF